MQSVQRRFGKLLPRTADESQVAVLLKDFDDADKMLAKIIDASKAWRDSWRDILVTQQRLVNGFQVMYEPFIGADDSHNSQSHLVTPESTVQRTTKLSQGYEELKVDLLDEVNMVDTRIIRPAIEAKEWIQPLKKVIKKREDRKLDFEKYQKRVDNASKKTKRSERDNAYLAKAETEAVRAKEEYAIADEHLKAKLPPVVSAAFSLLPHLLSSQIMTQNSLLGNYYTMLHDFCTEENYPSPPPPMHEIIGTWENEFKPAQREVEHLACIAGGKAVRQPTRSDSQFQSNGYNARNGSAQRRASNQSTLSIQSSQSTSLKPPVSPSISAVSDSPSPDSYTRPKISSVPSQTSLALATPNYSSSNAASPSPGDVLSTHAPAGPRADYFSRDRLPSTSSITSIAAAKKKPPPPPPKRVASNQGLWVTALYEFAGQGQGDLVFKEGDRIKVVQKTNSTDDWWEGELRGVQGSFPANYCQAT
ncbi:MAG: hypothetical protein Q9191_007336 [Dirinaria sp. TL-2023a]